MKNGIKRFAGVLIVCTLFITGCDAKPKQKQHSAHESIGKCSNGLSYYVRENHYDKDKASLRLAVKVGSLQEEDSERGLAHFLEHMVFRGSENYSDYEVVDFLESIGASFGADTNAYTSFDQTVYMFEVPLSKEGSLEKAISMLSEFAMKANIDNELVQKEKTVVMDELRMRQDSSSGRNSNKLFETLLEHTKYGERLPIGLEEVILSADSEKLRAFYEKWYRPENMALIVVGDFQKDEVLGYMEKYFATLPKSKKIQTTSVPAIHDYDEEFSSIIEDPETVGNSFLLAQFGKSNKGISDEDFLINLKDQLIFAMQNRRLAIISQEDNSPFKAAQFMNNRFNMHNSIYVNYATAWDDDPQKALDRLLVERKRFENTPFTQSELDLALTNIKSGLKVAIENADKHKNHAYIQSYMNHFIFGERLMGFDEEAKFNLALLDKIDLDSINKRKEFFANKSKKALLYIPQKSENKVAKEQLDVALASFDTLEIQEEVQKDTKTFALDSSFAKGSIVDTKEYEKSGIKKLVLSNGVTVYLDKTDLKENLFSVKMVGRRGLYSFANEDLISAANASSYANKSGLAGLTYVELSDALSGKEASMDYGIYPTSRVVSGGSNNEDMDYLFKMIQALFTDKYFREDSWKQQVKLFDERKKAKQNSPSQLFFESIPRSLYSNHYFHREFETEELNREKAEKAIQTAFSNPEEFTLIIVGDFDENKLLTSLETYIASIPKENNHFPEHKFSEFTIPKGAHENVFKKGIGEEAFFFASFPIDSSSLKGDWKDAVKLMVFQDAMKTRLQKVLRRTLGETYGVHASVDFPFHPSMKSACFSVFFPTSPGKVPEMKEAMLSEMKKIKEEKLTQEEISTSLGIYKENRKKALLSNQGRIQRIEGHLLYNIEPVEYLELDEFEDEFEQERFNNEILKTIDLENRIFNIKVPESSDYGA